VQPEKTSLTSEQHVFISYCRANQDYANRLCSWLNGHGVRTWIDQRIARGTKWEPEIYAQLDIASALIVLISKAAQRSTWVEREVAHALHNGIPIYPLLLEVNGMLSSVAHLQLDNVSSGSMPSIQLCQRLPGFLVTESDLAQALTEEQKAIAQRVAERIGVIGPNTRDGPAVAAIQMELLRVGLDPGPVDGVLRPETRNAIREFQARRCHIPTADGIVGPRILTVLVNSSFGDLSAAASPPTNRVPATRSPQKSRRD